MYGMQLGLQEPASPIQEGVLRFHDHLMVILVFVVVFVGSVLWRIVSTFRGTMVLGKRIHGGILEIIWTIIPAFLLMGIAVPSFSLLYAVDEAIDSDVTVKVVGHQWYWTYEYGEEGIKETYEMYMVGEEELDIGELRLLEVDNRIYVPIRSHVRWVVTAGDVLHCFAVPALGLKMDACPGRLNEIMSYIKREGVYYGQCSELCGVNHGFMPIVVEGLKKDEFMEYMNELRNE